MMTGNPSEIGVLRTLPQAAELLQVSTKTVRRMIKSGALRCHYVGRQIRFTEADIGAFLNSSKEKPNICR